MATRYWVGGTGTWDATAGTKWSATEGGTGGSTVPTTTDDVFVSGKLAPNWTATTALSLGAFRSPTIVGGNGYYYEVTTAGTTGATEPTWGTTVNGTTVSGSVTFTCRLATITLGINASINTCTFTSYIGTFAFGTNKISLGGSSATIFSQPSTMTVTGTPVIDCTYSGATGTRTITTSSVSESNSISFNVTAGTDTFANIATAAIKNLNFTGFSGTFASTSRSIYGSLTISTGMTVGAGSTATTFAATSGTQTITTNGKTLDFPITFTGIGGTWVLQDNLNAGSRVITFNGGTLNLNNFNLSGFSFSSSGSNTRVLAFGTGQINLNGNATGTLWDSSVTTNFTTTGTQVVNCTYSGATGTRTINTGALVETSSITFNITGGTDVVSITGSIKDLVLTGFAGTFSNVARTVYGSLTISTGMTITAGTNATTFAATSGTKTITSNAKTFDFPVTFDGIGGIWQLQDALTIGSSRTTTLTNGTLNLNNLNLTTGLFSSNNSNTRTLAFGTGQIYLTGNNTSIWRTDSGVGLTMTGTPTVNSTYSGATGTRTIVNTNTSGTLATAINLNVTGGSDIFTSSSGNSMFKDVNFTGYTGAAVFGGQVLGNLTYGTGMTNISTNGVVVFNNTGTQTITSNGVTHDAPLQIGQRVTTTGASGTGSVATITFSSTTNFYFPVGSTIVVSGVTPTGYNGTYTVTASTLTSVSYASTTTGAQTVAGSVSVPSTVQLADNLTTGTTRTVSFVSGTLNLNNFILSCGSFNSNNSSTRTLAFSTSGSITINGSTVAGGWQLAAGTYSVTGTNPVVNFNAGTSAVTKTVTNGPTNVSFNFLSGTDGIAINTNFSCNNVNFTGYSGTLTYVNPGGMFIYGNLTLGSGATWSSSSTFFFGFYGTSGTKTITTSGLTLDVGFVFDGACTWQFTDALTQGSTRTFTFNKGTIQLKNGVTSTVGVFTTTGTFLKYLRSTTSGSQATLSQANGTVTATYLDIQDSNATGGATFDARAITNVNSGNNTGWLFTATSNGNFFLLFA